MVTMKTVKIILSNGNGIITRINGTEEEIQTYYMKQIFNVSTVQEETNNITKYATCKEVIFL